MFAPYNKKGKAKNKAGDAIPEEEHARLNYEWDFPAERTFRVENVTGFVKEGRIKPLKYRDMTIRGLGLEPTDFTAGGAA